RESADLRATGTAGQEYAKSSSVNHPRKEPTLVACCGPKGGNLPPSVPLRIASNFPDGGRGLHAESGPRKTVAAHKTRRRCTDGGQVAPNCTARKGGRKHLSPTGFEPVTFGSGGYRMALPWRPISPMKHSDFTTFLSRIKFCKNEF